MLAQALPEEDGVGGGPKTMTKNSTVVGKARLRVRIDEPKTVARGTMVCKELCRLSPPDFALISWSAAMRRVCSKKPTIKKW
jgi:hypothetical protein